MCEEHPGGRGFADGEDKGATHTAGRRPSVKNLRPGICALGVLR